MATYQITMAMAYQKLYLRKRDFVSLITARKQPYQRTNLKFNER